MMHGKNSNPKKKSMKVMIRRATEADANQIAFIHINTWQTIYRGLIPDEILNNLSLTKREQEWQERLQAGVITWVIEYKNTLIGFASVCPTRDADGDPKIVAEISAIYLLPEFWRKGLGQQLCEVIIDNVSNNNFKEIVVWVLAGNNQARHFYEAVGFHKTGDSEIDHIGDKSLPVLRYRKILVH